MKTKQWLILLASCLALAAAPLTGCGDDEDPSTNNSANNDGNDGGNTDTGDAGTDTDDDGGEPDASDAGDGGDGGGDDGGDATDPPECEANDFFSGQTYTGGQNPDVHNGGELLPASEVTLADANLQAVYDAVPTTGDDDATEDIDESTNTLDTPIAVTDALVIGTSRTDNPETTDVIEGNDHLWLQDANAEIVFYRAFPEGEAPTEAIQVGDLVSFNVTEVKNYSGTPEITAITDFVVSSPAEGEAENPVPFTDLTGQEITIDHWGKLVRVSGQITEDKGECPPDSGSKCFTLTHGENGEQTIELRTSSSWVEMDACATFLGPLGAFPTPLDPQGGTPQTQLQSTNWGWTFTPPTD